MQIAAEKTPESRSPSLDAGRGDENVGGRVQDLNMLVVAVKMLRSGNPKSRCVGRGSRGARKYEPQVEIHRPRQ